MQEKTQVLCQQAAKIRLLVNNKKTEIMRNLDNTAPITLDNGNPKRGRQVHIPWKRGYHQWRLFT